MAELKTKTNDVSVADFLGAIPHTQVLLEPVSLRTRLTAGIVRRATRPKLPMGIWLPRFEQ